jgi:hypothetical protein
MSSSVSIGFDPVMVVSAERADDMANSESNAIAAVVRSFMGDLLSWKRNGRALASKK